MSVNDEVFNLSLLPDDIILDVFTFLSFRDLINCSHICKRFHQLSQHDPPWRIQCHKYSVTNSGSDEKTWRATFIDWFHDLGQYVDVYLDIYRAWGKIEKYMETHCPIVYNSLQDGVTEAELDRLEAHMQLKLPRDIRCAYRIHNGQKPGFGPGLMGSMAVSSHYWTEYLLPIHMATDNLQSGSDLEGCLPVTFCFQSHMSQMIALCEEAGYTQGQMFYPCPHGAYSADSDRALMDNFLVARNFREWFCNYAQELEDDKFPRIRANGVCQVFKFYHDPSCIATTGNISVKVVTAFSTELSTIHPPHFVHIYHITMLMDEDAMESESCRLETRRWVITDEDGHQEVVDGAGVVGEFPVMSPGASFSWTSLTSFTTTYGSMHGHFTMRNLHDGSSVDVECPVFHMKCLPYQTSSERRPQQATSASAASHSQSPLYSITASLISSTSALISCTASVISNTASFISNTISLISNNTSH